MPRRKKGGEMPPQLAKYHAVARMRAAKRRPLVWAMHQKGMSLREIQAELEKDGFTCGHATIGKDVKAWADELNKTNLATTTRQRRVQLERITTAIKGIWAKVVKGDLPSVRELIRLIDIEAKLLGLYAPAKIDIEHRLRQLAKDEDMDPDEFVREAERAVREHQLT